MDTADEHLLGAVSAKQTYSAAMPIGPRKTGAPETPARIVTSAPSVAKPAAPALMALLGVLDRASARGVELNIITNGPLSTDSDVETYRKKSMWRNSVPQFKPLRHDG